MSDKEIRDIAGYQEMKFKDLKVGMNILITFHHGFECGNKLVVRHGVVKECNGYCIVAIDEAGGDEIMLMPGDSLRNERYYTRYLKGSVDLV